MPSPSPLGISELFFWKLIRQFHLKVSSAIPLEIVIIIERNLHITIQQVRISQPFTKELVKEITEELPKEM